MVDLAALDEDELLALKKQLTHKITKRENRQLRIYFGRVRNNKRLRTRIYAVDRELIARGLLMAGSLDG